MSVSHVLFGWIAGVALFLCPLSGGEVYACNFLPEAITLEPIKVEWKTLPFDFPPFRSRLSWQAAPVSRSPTRGVFWRRHTTIYVSRTTPLGRD